MTKHIDADKLKAYYAWWGEDSSERTLFDAIIDVQPAADVVPWEWLERYADYFCAGVSMPEFVREAKMFYESSNKAMQGGVIGG